MNGAPLPPRLLKCGTSSCPCVCWFAASFPWFGFLPPFFLYKYGVTPCISISNQHHVFYFSITDVLEWDAHAVYTSGAEYFQVRRGSLPSIDDLQIHCGPHAFTPTPHGLCLQPYIVVFIDLLAGSDVVHLCFLPDDL